MPTSNIGSLSTYLVGDAIGLRRTFVRAGMDIQNYVSGVERASSLSSRALMGIVGASVALSAVSVASFASLEDATVSATAILENNSKSVTKALMEQADAVSLVSTTTATDLTQAYLKMSSAGKKAEQQIKALSIVEKFARAGNLGLASATSALVDVQNTMGLASEDSAQDLKNLTRISNVLARSNSLAQTSVEEMSRAMTQMGATTLRNMNIPLEEGVAILTAFAERGIKGAKAGRWMTIMFRELNNSAVKYASMWDRYGLRVFDEQTQQFRGTATVLRELNDVYQRQTDQGKTMMLQQLGFSRRAVQSIKTVIDTSDRIELFTAKLKEAGNYVENVAAKRMDTLASKAKLVWNSFTSLLRTIGELVSEGADVPGMLDSIKTTLDNVNNAIKALDTPTAKMVVRIGMLTAGYVALHKAMTAITLIGGVKTGLSIGGALLSGGALTSLASFGGLLGVIVSKIAASATAWWTLTAVVSGALGYWIGSFEKIKTYLTEDSVFSNWASWFAGGEDTRKTGDTFSDVTTKMTLMKKALWEIEKLGKNDITRKLRDQIKNLANLSEESAKQLMKTLREGARLAKKFPRPAKVTDQVTDKKRPGRFVDPGAVAFMAKLSKSRLALLTPQQKYVHLLNEEHRLSTRIQLNAPAEGRPGSKTYWEDMNSLLAVRLAKMKHLKQVEERMMTEQTRLSKLLDRVKMSGMSTEQKRDFLMKRRVEILKKLRKETNALVQADLLKRYSQLTEQLVGMRKSGGGGEPQFAQAVKSGSLEAYNLSVKSDRRKSNTLQKPVEDIDKEVKTISGLLNGIKDGLKNLNTSPVVDGGTF